MPGLRWAGATTASPSIRWKTISWSRGCKTKPWFTRPSATIRSNGTCDRRVCGKADFSAGARRAAAASWFSLSVTRCGQYSLIPGPGRPRQMAEESVMSMQERKLVHSDIKPENPPERAAHYLDVPNMPWEATKFPGIKIKVLYTDDSGITTALFKLDPGAVVPLHEHTALEQTYVIEGSLEDHEGKCGPGQFVWRPAGNQHEAVAPNGAVLLGFFSGPIASPMAKSFLPRRANGNRFSTRLSNQARVGFCVSRNAGRSS